MISFPKNFFFATRNKTGDEPQNLRPFFTFNGCSWGARSLSLFRHLSIRVNRPVFPVAWARAYTTSWNRKIIWSLEYRAEKRYSGNGETKSKALRIGCVLSYTTPFFFNQTKVYLQCSKYKTSITKSKYFKCHIF